MDITYKDRFDHVCSSLMFCSHALLELTTLTTKYSLKEANSIIAKAPFNFYRATLTYLITLEYTKLFNHKENGKCMSNVKLLWDEVIKNKLIKDGDSGIEIAQKLDNIPTSDFFQKMKILRNKKFAHSDFNDVNKPFYIQGLEADDINILSQHLDVVGYIMNLIKKGEDDYLLFPHKQELFNSTETFIYDTTIARAFYLKNHVLAYNQGFQLWHRRIH